ncbi:hypothetical protein ACW7N6_38120 [Streptomyces sp. UC1A3]
MTQSTPPERKPCGTCGKECSVNADGTIRHHLTDNPDWQSGPDSRKCKGAGQPPAGAAGVALAEDMEADGPQCRLCRHPVQLTSNGRARSHLTPEATPRPCPGGSDFPLGQYPDLIGTTDGLVATLAADCEHVPVGQCYGCHGAAGGAISDAELAAMEEAQGTGAAPWGVAPESVTQPTMADQFKSTPLTALMERETAGVGTVLDAMDGDARSEAERFAGAAPATHTGRPSMHSGTAYTGAISPEKNAEYIRILEQRTPEQKARTAAAMDRTASAVLGLPHDPELNHTYTDPSGTTWTHEGPEESCQTPDCRVMNRPEGFDPACGRCQTDDHRCQGCGVGVRHGVVACDECERELLARKLPAGTTEDGRRCEHHEAIFGVENGRAVCIACGTPCTHPDGFKDTADIPDRDGQDRVVSTCGLCGAMHPDDEEPDEQDCKPAEAGPHARTEEVQRAAWQALNEDWAQQRAESPTGPVRLGDLDEGDHFVRRGTLMRLTERESSTSVLAVVIGGPHDGREGELKNLNEMVERAPAPRTEEQETTECTDKTTPQQQPRSSAAPTPTTAPAPGSKPPTEASAPAVLSESNRVTSSAPTARAATRGGSAAVTTDQADAAARFLGGGRPTAPATAGPANQADAAAQFLAGGSGAHGEKETKRDRFGRYLIPHPDTGKETAWTRSTTFAKSISDTYALSQWGLRMALLGATVRPDIVQRAHGKHVRADKQLLDELTAELKSAAGDKVAANLGTAMHSFTEMADRAWHSPGGARSILDQVPPDCRDMVETYIRLLEETGLEPVPHLIEFTTVVKQYGVAGTSDNCYKVTKPLTLKIGRAEVRFQPGDYTIGDKKTGRDLDYGWQEIAIQLGTYAQGINTAGVWDRQAEEWNPDPLNGGKVRLDAGIVIHLPVDEESEKTPAVYGIDLESGWNAAVLCERVRAWRKVRNLASPVMVSEAETFAPSRTAPTVTTRTSVRPPTLREKANAVTSRGEASAVWQEATKAGLSKAEVDALVDVMQARLKKLAEPAG